MARQEPIAVLARPQKKVYCTMALKPKGGVGPPPDDCIAPIVELLSHCAQDGQIVRPCVSRFVKIEARDKAVQVSSRAVRT